MDFLDPKKQKAHATRLIVGYVLIGLVLLLATTILLFQAFGFGIDRHGRLIQNGLVYVSSAPDGAEIYVDGKRRDNTNTRLLLPAGQYVFEVKRDGYHPWKRAITVEGGTLQRFDYPFLFPEQFTTSTTKQYNAQPGLVSQSLDRRWVLIHNNGDTFDLFDLDVDDPTPESLTVPGEILSAGTNTTGWEEVEWADDHKHVVLKRLFTKNGQPSSEYVLIDREEVARSVNLSVRLGFTPTTLQLRGHDYDKYYAFDQPNGTLFTATLDRPTPQPYLSKVLAFQSDDDNVLFATSEKAPPGKTLIRLRQGDDPTYTIRQVASDAAPYLLDLARFEDSWYVAAGASGEDKVYVYENPLDVLKSDDGDVLVPVHILKVEQPNYLAFAPASRFIVAENGPEFATYDVKNNKGYDYRIDATIDSTIGHAAWMNGYYLTAVSNGRVLVFDYDGANRETLVPSAPTQPPIFDRQYLKLYTFTTNNAWTSSDLRTERDR